MEVKEVLRKLITKKRIIIFSLVVVIAAGSLYGLYQYTLNRYSQEVGELFEMIDVLLAEEKDQQGTNGGTGGVPETKIGEDRNSSKAQEDSSGENDSSTTQEGSSDRDGDAGQDETSPSTGEPDPLQDKKEDFLRQMDSSDKRFIFSMLRRFSTDELRHMYELYQEEGSDALQEIRDIVDGRFDDHEIDKIREMAEEYKELK